ncbi:MAG: MFS transporter [Gammaproteobacteria bacterium]
MTSPSPSPPPGGRGVFEPFGYPAFTVMWLATLASMTGTWMHEVAAGWLMATLATDPRMVALVQTATMLPGLLFVLPAGALADLFDRRRLLILVRLVMSIVALALGYAALAGRISPWGLLAFTFLLGMGNAFTAPVWQAIVPQMVPRPVLAQAISLNSLAVNFSRALGPALAGALIASVGFGAPFLVNAVAYLALVAAVVSWKPPEVRRSELPSEGLVSAMRAGLRYVRSSVPVKSTLVRAVTFLVPASAYWALMPLVVRDQLGGGAQLYGLMVGSVGAGAVVGAVALPFLRAALGADRLVLAASLGTVLALAGFSVASQPAVAGAAAMLAGFCWISALSSMNVSMQMALPEWVRGRGLSVYHMSFFGSMAVGSYLWGHVAGWLGVPATLAVAGGVALLATPFSLRWRLLLGADLDLSPSVRWPEPVPAWRFPADRGPVLITVEYRVPESRRERFLGLLEELEHCRRRGGAVAWGIFQDVADPGRFVETFLEVSWVEHLRHHERVTAADRVILDAAAQCHEGPGGPPVTHLVRPGPGDPVGSSGDGGDAGR